MKTFKNFNDVIVDQIVHIFGVLFKYHLCCGTPIPDKFWTNIISAMRSVVAAMVYTVTWLTGNRADICAFLLLDVAYNSRAGQIVLKSGRPDLRRIVQDSADQLPTSFDAPCIRWLGQRRPTPQRWPIFIATITRPLSSTDPLPIPLKRGENTIFYEGLTNENGLVRYLF